MPDEGGDPKFEPLIGQYLSSNLDGQLGRAAANFRAQADRIDQGRSQRRDRTRGVMVGMLALAAAASLLVGVPFWLSHLRERAQFDLVDKAIVHRGSETGEQPQPQQVDGAHKLTAVSTPVDQQPVLVEQSVRWRTLDEGIVMIDDRTPVRKVRRQWLERRRWFDAARGAQMEQVVPREEVVFLEMAVY